MKAVTFMVHILSYIVGVFVVLSSKVQASEQDAVTSSRHLQNVTFHVMGLAHTIVREDFSICAFTMKVLKLCSMLNSLGLHSILYSNEGSVHECSKLEVILDDKERQHYFGTDEAWKSGGWFDFNNVEGNALFKARTTQAVNQNKNASRIDILLATFGYAHYEISQSTGLTTIESGIGYDHSFARFRVYESYAFLHSISGNNNINNYHRVIPNCFYPSDFEGANSIVQGGGRYFAFIARLIENKGINIVLAIMEHMPEDYTLHVAGQGNIRDFVPQGHPLYDRVIYHGVVGHQKRNDILFGAEALITPTMYREPFGGVMVEAQMLGTPVITTDHAAMVETVWHGVTGYRCHTLRCFVGAAKQVHLLNRSVIAKRARDTYSCDVIQYQYEDYFQDVINLWGNGWYDLDSGVGHLLDQRDLKDFYPKVADGELEAQQGSCATKAQ